MKKTAVILAFMLLAPLTTFADVTTDTTNSAFTDTTGSATTATTPTDTSGTAAATTPASNSSFSADGVFSCAAGQYAAPASIGSNAATQAAYVPVDSSTLDVNTYTDVYHQCILRPVVDAEKRAATVAITKQIYTAVQTGRNGNPEYVVNEEQEEVTGPSDSAELGFLQDSVLWNQVNPDMQASLKTANATYYEGERSNEQAASVVCPYKGSLNSYWSGQVPFNFTDFLNAAQPQCDPIIENTFLQDIADSRRANALQNQQNQWNWANGFYSRTDANGNIITPGILEQQMYGQVLQSPFDQLQNANDIGQMVGALYSGLGTQILGGQGGLSGLAQSSAGQSSYLDQVASESSQGLQNSALNAGIQILAAQQQLESSLYQAVSGIAQSLLQTQSQLQAAEAQCWVNLIPKVCATPLKSDNTCVAYAGPCVTDQDGNQTCPTGPTLKVATSTAFSSAIISSQITPLLGPATTQIQNSRSALQVISNLVQGITNTASLDAQSQALQQLDTLVAQHQLHAQTDLQNATQQQQAVSTTMASLLQSTAQTWGGSGSDGSGNFPWDGTTNPGNGWCNINNSATIQAWIQKWTKK